MGGRYGGNIGHGSGHSPWAPPRVRQITTQPCASCGGHFLHYNNCTTNPKPGSNSATGRTVLRPDPQSDN